MASTCRNLFAALVVTAISFAVLEGLTRLVFQERLFDTTLLYSNGTLEAFNDELGWTLNPGVVQRIRTTENEVVTYRTDSRGFRTSAAGADGVPASFDPAAAVLFVGDSITFGINANTSYPEEFSRISRLRSINAGVPRFGTDQAFLMARTVIDDYGARPTYVVYGFYWNDIQNNVSGRSIHTAENVVIHKPVLDPDTNTYRKAERSKNDITAQYAPPDALQAAMILASESKFLRSAGRVLKYNVAARFQSAPAPQFDEQAQRYLKGNLDQFEAYLRARGTKFVLLHVPGGRPDLERQLTTCLQTYARAHGILYVHPELGAADYLRTDFHLSEQGARHVADELWAMLK